MKGVMLFFVAAGLWHWASRGKAEDQYPRAELLLEPAELASAQVAERSIVLDARSRRAYEEEHIANARWVDHAAWSKAFHETEGEDAAKWGRRIGDLGIEPESKVVVYDDVAMKDAARIWWILRYWGVEDVRLLNGGWKAWKAAELPTSDEISATVEPVEFEARPLADRLADKQDVLGLLGSDRVQVVDARSEGEFCGTDKLSNQRAGAIPGAKHLDWSELVDPKSHRFKPPEELSRLFDEAGIDLDRPTISHCQSGGRASVMAFGLELMGAEEVRNYYRGWSEWGNSDDTPVEPGKK